MSFASRLEGLLQQVGLSGVVEEVRTRLGYARPNPPPAHNGHGAPRPIERRESPVAPAPPGAPEPTRVERTPRPRPIIEEPPAPAAEVAAEEPAPPTKAAKARKAKVTKSAKGAPKAPAPKPGKSSPARSKPRAKKRESPAAAASPTADAGQAVDRLMAALRTHPRHEELASAGKLKDQLVRSLIPLYLARAAELDMEVTSGTTSRFWGELGVTYAAPNAAKALRLHAGYAQDTKKGKAITAKGVQYVEDALKRLRDGEAS
ncbi:hypothetical protein VZQ01_29605 [Myxococcus faecalis]|uniref:hypothetical protein n=1 Tax=Myxococcus TaxID=32 RepID=UPI001CBA7FB9|nr:hypothetical protein [Myxococcus sp. AS-1-15]MBZ4410059.1 hypothetical protein [Myxococcus sp. XM-1-1-1]BDT36869.1 hypothetical protein MFMH1_65380 [Myxococcus sp. MH1]